MAISITSDFEWLLFSYMSVAFWDCLTAHLLAAFPLLAVSENIYCRSADIFCEKKILVHIYTNFQTVTLYYLQFWGLAHNIQPHMYAGLLLSSFSTHFKIRGWDGRYAYTLSKIHNYRRPAEARMIYLILFCWVWLEPCVLVCHLQCCKFSNQHLKLDLAAKFKFFIICVDPMKRRPIPRSEA